MTFLGNSETFRKKKTDDWIISFGSGASFIEAYEDDRYLSNAKQGGYYTGIPIDLRFYLLRSRTSFGLNVSYHFIVTSPEKEYVAMSLLFALGKKRKTDLF